MDVTTGTAAGKVDRTRLYRNGPLEKENFPVKDVSDYLSSAIRTHSYGSICAGLRYRIWITSRRHSGFTRWRSRMPWKRGSAPKLDRYSEQATGARQRTRATPGTRLMRSQERANDPVILSPAMMSALTSAGSRSGRMAMASPIKTRSCSMNAP